MLGFGEWRVSFSRRFKSEGILNWSGDSSFGGNKRGDIFGKRTGVCRVQERETKGEGRERKSCNFAGSTHDCSCFVSRVGKILQSECCIRRFSVKSSILSSKYAHRLLNISHVATLALCLGLGGATVHIWKYQTKSRTASGDLHADHSRQSGCLLPRP